MSGIYCIKVDNCIVYIGKAKSINDRVCQHWVSILGKAAENKYQLLNDSCRRNHKISFWLLEECSIEQLNKKETKWIQLVKPCLNSKCNCGCGIKITAQEYYDIILNQSHEIEGTKEFQYKTLQQIHDMYKHKQNK